MSPFRALTHLHYPLNMEFHKGRTKHRMGPYGLLWDRMGPYETVWALMGPYGLLLNRMGTYGKVELNTVWDRMGTLTLTHTVS